ncbi:MAG: YqeG family HAD IIIA-type phosphatase [Oscillospiraceae bacterium]|nr:YqeG family HAD IIIA-type phosphatase [Oscillospiraceae bacterium]
MRFSLLPSMLMDSVTGIDQAFLDKRGIRLLMLDFDNTIVPYTTDEPTAEMERWLKSMAGKGVCVVSNSHNDRVKLFCQRYGMDCITHAKKPFPRGIRACLEKYGLQPEQCALAGDQIFTDTLGANCAGVRSILVKPIHNHNFWLKARHVLEKPFIYLARKRRVTQ